MHQNTTHYQTGIFKGFAPDGSAPQLSDSTANHVQTLCNCSKQCVAQVATRKTLPRFSVSQRYIYRGVHCLYTWLQGLRNAVFQTICLQCFITQHGIPMDTSTCAPLQQPYRRINMCPGIDVGLEAQHGTLESRRADPMPSGLTSKSIRLQVQICMTFGLT